MNIKIRYRFTFIYRSFFQKYVLNNADNLSWHYLICLRCAVPYSTDRRRQIKTTGFIFTVLSRITIKHYHCLLSSSSSSSSSAFHSFVKLFMSYNGSGEWFPRQHVFKHCVSAWICVFQPATLSLVMNRHLCRFTDLSFIFFPTTNFNKRQAHLWCWIRSDLAAS